MYPTRSCCYGTVSCWGSAELHPKARTEVVPAGFYSLLYLEHAWDKLR